MHKTPLLWTQRLHFGPAARLGHAMAYDAARQRVVLFGGVDATSKLGDTWVWDGTFWTQVAETGPSPRVSHALAYDHAREQVVLFGGWTGNTQMSDTWVWGRSCLDAGRRNRPVRTQLARDGRRRCAHPDRVALAAPPTTSWAIPGSGTEPPGRREKNVGRRPVEAT